MAEDHRLSGAPVLVVDVGAVFGRDRRHQFVPPNVSAEANAGPVGRGGRAVAATTTGSGQATYEAQGGRGDVAPTVVNGERVSPILDLDDLGDALVAPLLLVRSVGDRPRHGVIPISRNDQQRSPLWVLAVDLYLGPRIEVRRGRLEQWGARGRHRILLVKLLGFVLADHVRERVPELVIRQRDGAMDVGRVGQHW